MTMTSVFAPIFKSEEQDDGTVIVYGKATDDSLDRDNQRCDPNWLARAMPEWYKTGANVREQHDSKRAVGVGIGHDIAPDGHYVRAHIVDPVSVLKVKHGVLKGFSIGISNPGIVKTDDAPNGLINDGSICELSICDRPSNPGCMLQLAKTAEAGMDVDAADFDEARGLVRCQELVEKSQVDEATDAEKLDTEPEATKAEEPEVAKDASVATDIEVLTEDQVEAARNGGESPHDGCGCCESCTIAEVQAEEDADKFDRDAAKALVAQLTKAAPKKGDGDLPPEYGMEQGDIENAQSAISTIFQLIISEAQDGVDNPAQDCDIELLMQAVHALRCFVHREQHQQMGANVVPKPEIVVLSEEPDLEKAKYSAKQLRQMLKQGKAIKNANGDPSYPIGDKEDLENAIHAVGRGSGDHDQIRAYIVRRAKALGASDMIPENWTSSGSNKTAEGAEAPTDETTEDLMAKAERKAAKKAAKKAAEAELTKAAVVDDEAEGADALVKALTAALEKSDNPLRKSFTAMIEAATEDTAKSVSELTERLSKVEAMATPGGPARMRTETERKHARKADLLGEAERLRQLSRNAEDRDLREGYAMKAKALEAEIKALVA